MTDGTAQNDLDLLVGKIKSAASPLCETLRCVYDKFLGMGDGAVADYIPELAKANPDCFGVAMRVEKKQAG